MPKPEPQSIATCEALYLSKRHLSHLTLNTGHIVLTVRDDMDGVLVDHLLPLVDGGGGPLPGMPAWHLALSHMHGPRRGATYLQIAAERGMSQTPAVMGVACWAPTLSRSAWSFVQKSYAAQRPALRQAGIWRAPPSVPPAAPWLAVWLTPLFATVDRQDIGAMGFLERCLVWALIESE